MLGHHIAAEVVRRGHDVVCAARGSSGGVPEGARLVRVDRDRPDALAPLAGERFDAVVDTATMSYPWVADALRAFAGHARHWTFVSSINVYADTATPGQTAEAPRLEPRQEGAPPDPSADPDLYGAIKTASEDAVLDALGPNAFVVRPGLITGPGDVGDRFGYWPARMLRGGRVLVPDAPDQPIQYIDVRDLAAWIGHAIDNGIGGCYDGIGPSCPLPELLGGIAEAVGTDVELVPAAHAALRAAGVNPWSGPRSLPLWLPTSHYGLADHDARPAMEAGLRLRSLADAVAGALDRERELGLDRERTSGLSPEQEADVLAGL